MEAIAMSEKYGFPVNKNRISKAGITIHIDPLDDKTEPFDVTLYIKKPGEGEDTPNPDDDNSFTTTGKLTFRFGKRGSIELFVEDARQIDRDFREQEEEL
jgi:hypothetical protein